MNNISGNDISGGRAMFGTRPDRPVLICFSHLRWNFVYQRPQHLLSRAANDYSVYFFEEPIIGDVTTPQLRQVDADGIRVLTPHLPQGLDQEATTSTLRAMLDRLVGGFGQRQIIEWYYTPMALEFSADLDADFCVYDCMDELSAFRGASPELAAREQQLFARADAVFTGGQSLFEAKRDRHRNVHAFPSSVDKAHFARARRLKSQTDTPRIGFFGVIDERMDVDLVAEAARLRPNYQFDMVGPVVKIDESTLPRRANLNWLGGRSYQELPEILAGWSLGFMPFAINEHTRFISPTKTPEFLAAGLPVVSTAISDVVRPYGELGLVEIASSPDEAVAAFDRLLDRPQQPWLSEVDRYLKDLSWDLTWERMRALIALPEYQSLLRSTADV